MPHIIIKHFPKDLDDALREKLKTSLAEVVQTAFGCDPGAISIALQSVPAEHWHQAVYRPDIEPHIGHLLKSPEYRSQASKG